MALRECLVGTNIEAFPKIELYGCGEDPEGECADGHAWNDLCFEGISMCSRDVGEDHGDEEDREGENRGA